MKSVGFCNEEEAWPLSCSLKQFDAILFDLDGTLVDTMPIHGRAYSDIFDALGYRFSLGDYLAHVGPPARIAVREFAKAAGFKEVTDELVKRIHADKKKRFGEILAREAPAVLPAAALLTRHRGEKAMALVSSGNRDGVQAILSRMGWGDMFDIVISGDDVEHGKPHHEPYSAGAKALGVPPSRCVAFEDTQAGLSSALGAGMYAVDVTVPGALHAPELGL
jgi:beta-phosphoglucomutase